LTPLLERLDDALGEGLERYVRRHHRRRLERLGHGQFLRSDASELWAEGEPPPRGGNELEVLIDGERALPAIAAALQDARSHVHITGWHVTPEFALVRGEPEVRLRELLAELAEHIDVRVLLWAGPPVPVFRPHRSDVRKVRDELMGGTRISCELDARERTMHCHHEKLVVVDDETAFVGGIDLTSLSGDRFDSSEHRADGDLGWHDVATRIRGPAVADVADHFRQRWREVAREPLPAPARPEPAGGVELQVVRTVPERTYHFARKGEFRIFETYLRALRSAESLIYIENQFIWSAEIAEVLADKLRRAPRDDFRLVLLLPANPNNGADTTRGQLGRLIEADADRGRVLPVTIHCHSGTRSHSLYVHAKVAVVDDRWLTVGSANLNEHSLFNDTEVNVVTTDSDLARRTRLELWSEHLERPVSEVSGDPAAVVDDMWKPIADEQLARRESGAPLTHRLIRLPAVSRRSKRLIGPMRGLLVDA
jgi:phosphatidylserine/phosphatidylglycerophosphate/cardiolipin synthase-like enzyme